jgi:hypothetical protein
MPISIEALGKEQEGTLGAAYTAFREQWRSGDRDRELALHLFFLAWYLAIEPPHLTGFSESGEDLPAMAEETHAFLLPNGAASTDAEALFIVGLAAYMFGWFFGDEKLWEARSQAYRRRYRELAPGGIDPAVFNERGYYGKYYADQSSVDGGY